MLNKIKMILPILLFLVVSQVEAFDQPIQTPPLSFASDFPSFDEAEKENAQYYLMLEKQIRADKIQDTLNLQQNRALISRMAQRYLSDFKQQNSAYLNYLRQNLNPRNWDEEKEKVLKSYKDLLLNPQLSKAWLIVNGRIFNEFSLLLEKFFQSLFNEGNVQKKNRQ